MFKHQAGYIGNDAVCAPVAQPAGNIQVIHGPDRQLEPLVVGGADQLRAGAMVIGGQQIALIQMALRTAKIKIVLTIASMP